MPSVEFLIVGQGLAGTALSWQLHRKGRSFLVIDLKQPNSPSRVAAGLINPVTGRNLNPTWKVDELLPLALNQYRQMDQFLGINSLHEIPVWRFFQREREVEKFNQQIADTPEYLAPLPENIELEHLNHSFGGAEIVQGGWLDTEVLIDHWRSFLINSGQLVEDLLDLDQLEMSPTEIRWKETSTKHLVLCPGYLPKKHPFFPSLPFSLTKGEILTVKGLDWPEDRIYMYNYFMVPVGDGQWRLGATYNWNQMDTKPTSEARDIMINKWKKVYGGQLTVVDHRAGIRPSTSDRMPLLGTHPTYSNLHLLTGLGSKGAIQAPWLAPILVGAIDDKTAIPKEILWNRNKKKHYNR